MVLSHLGAKKPLPNSYQHYVRADITTRLGLFPDHLSAAHFDATL